MKKPLSFLLPAVALCLAAFVACNKEKSQGSDVLFYGISLSETAITLSETGECQLTADYSPADKAVVIWQSSNPNAVSVSDDGLVKALVGEGEETVQAILLSTVDYQIKAYATCTVNLNTNYSAKLNKKAVTLQQDETCQLTLTRTPSEATEVVWMSSNDEVVSVSQDGLVTAIYQKDSEELVWAEVYSKGDGLLKASDTCLVSIHTPLIEKLILPVEYPKVLQLKVGTDFQLNPVIVPEEAKDVPLTYELNSDGQACATVSETGLLHPFKKSSGIPTLKVIDGRRHWEYLMNFSVDDADIYPTSISLDGMKEECAKGANFEVTMNYEPASATVKTYSVTSSNTTVATVIKTSAGFRVSPRATGSATITVTYYISESSTKKIEKNLTVHEGTPSISWNNPSSLLAEGLIVGDTFTEAATVSNLTNKKVVYSTSNPSVATVDANGKITAVGKGTTTFRATADADPYLGLAKKITVYGKPVKLYCSTLGSTEDQVFIRYGDSRTLNFQLRDSDGAACRHTSRDFEVSTPVWPGTMDMSVTSKVKDNGIEVTLKSNRTSATSTIKGTLTVLSKVDYTANMTLHIYDAMYSASDVKPFDGVYFSQDGRNYKVVDGGFRGSGYFAFTPTASDLKDCNALVVWVGQHTTTSNSPLKSLYGIGRGSVKAHGSAIYFKSLPEKQQWWSVTTDNVQDAVSYSSQYWSYWPDGVNEGADPTSYGTRGWDISAGEKYYNQHVSSSKWKMIPIQYIQTQAPQLAESSFHGGWYLPTSGEWYRMLTSLGDDSTMEETRKKISEWLNTMGGTGLGAGTSYWSCQEAEDAPHQEAVYVTGAQATKSGTKPVLTADKHDTKYVRPFIAF